MSRDILPVFEQAAIDRQAAEAFSEIYFHGQDFKIATEDPDTEKTGQFPSVPAYLGGVCAAYWEDVKTEHELRRQGMLVPPWDSNIRQRGEALIADYRSIVGGYQDIAKSMQEDNPKAAVLNEVLMRKSASKAHTAGLRTVACFAIFTAAESGQYLTGLSIPRKVYTDLPLEHREHMLDLLPRFEQVLGAGSNEDQAAVRQLRESVKPILQNHPAFGNMAFMAAALTLPEPDAIEAGVDQQIELIEKGANKQRYAGMNRQERRKLQHKERRQQHRRDSGGGLGTY